MNKSSVLVKTEGQHSPFIIQLGESCCTLTLLLELTDEGTVGQSTPGASPVIYRERVLLQSWLLTMCFAEHLVRWHPLRSLAVWAHKSLNTSVLQSNSKTEALSLLMGFVVVFPWDFILMKGLRLSEPQQGRYLRRTSLSHPLFNCLNFLGLLMFFRKAVFFLPAFIFWSWFLAQILLELQNC